MHLLHTYIHLLQQEIIKKNATHKTQMLYNFQKIIFFI